MRERTDGTFRFVIVARFVLFFARFVLGALHVSFCGLYDDGKYRFILSGSLLGVELKDIKSYPVGYIGIKEVFPLSFREFIKKQSKMSLQSRFWVKKF